MLGFVCGRDRRSRIFCSFFSIEPSAIEMSEESPDRPIVEVTLSAAQVTDEVLEHLEGLTSLPVLFLWGA